MRHVVAATESGSHTVGRPEPRICQGHAAQQGGETHVFSGGQVGAVAECDPQALSHPANAFQTQTVCEGICPPRNVGLDQLGEGIQSGMSRLFRRKRQRQLRIHKSHRGNQPRVAQAAFHPVRPGPKNRVLGHLRARPRCRGQSDVRQRLLLQLLARADAFQVVQNRTGIRHQSGHGLAQVQHAPAAHAHDHVRCELPRLGHNSAHTVDRGLAGYAAEHPHGQPPGREGVHQFRESTAPLQTGRAGDQRHPLSPRGHELRQGLPLAAAENDTPGCRKLERIHLKNPLFQRPCRFHGHGRFHASLQPCSPDLPSSLVSGRLSA